MAKDTLNKISKVLLTIGGLNWGLAVFNFNFVRWLALAINTAILEPVIYGAVGISALVFLFTELIDLD